MSPVPLVLAGTQGQQLGPQQPLLRALLVRLVMLAAQVMVLVDAPGATKVNMRQLTRQNARHVKLGSTILPKVKALVFSAVLDHTMTLLELIPVYPAWHVQLENGHRRVLLSAHLVLLDTTPASARQSVRCAQQACMLHSAKIFACTVMQVRTVLTQQVRVLHVQEGPFPCRLPHSVSCVKQVLLRPAELLIAPYVQQIPIAVRVPAAAQSALRVLHRKKGPQHVTHVS